jgi:transcriptional regulator with XRE-family HTH domain
MRHPVRRVRSLLGRVPALRCFGTQKGFATLIGRTENYIRNVESGSLKFSKKLADAIEENTGISSTWLLSPEALNPNNPISDAEGNPWDPETAIQLIKNEITENKKALSEAIDKATQSGMPLPELLGEMVARAVRKEMDAGSYEFITDVAILLRSRGHLELPPSSEN